MARQQIGSWNVSATSRPLSKRCVSSAYGEGGTAPIRASIPSLAPTPSTPAVPFIDSLACPICGQYTGSRRIGQVMQRLPPRPRPSSPAGMVMTSTPALRSSVFV